MQLKIKVIKRQEETVDVENDLVTVYDIKKIVECRTDIPIKSQSLVYKGKPLADGRSLKHYSIRDGDKLFVAIKSQCGSLGSAHEAESIKSKRTLDTAEGTQGDRSGPCVAEETQGLRSGPFVAVPEGAERKCRVPGPILAGPPILLSLPPHQRGGCWKPKTKFWEKLNASLLRHFAQEDVDKIVRVVCEDMRRSVYDINLDSVELLAGEQLKFQYSQRESRAHNS